jgi:hypothetical protein
VGASTKARAEAGDNEEEQAKAAAAGEEASKAQRTFASLQVMAQQAEEKIRNGPGNVEQG